MDLKNQAKQFWSWFVYLFKLSSFSTYIVHHLLKDEVGDIKAPKNLNFGRALVRSRDIKGALKVR